MSMPFVTRLSLLPVLLAGIILGATAAARAADHATILMYHRFGEDQYPSTNSTLLGVREAA